MKRIWRKCLGFSLGFLVAGARAGEPASGPAAGRGREVIARSVPLSDVPAVQVTASQSPPPVAALTDRTVPRTGAAWAVPESRPLAVTLDRPRPIVSSAGAIQLTSFHTDAVDNRVFRGQSFDAQPMPPGASLLGRPTPVPAPAPFESTFGAPFGPPGTEDTGGDPDWEDRNCFGCGDGVIHNFNDLFYFDSELLLWWIRGSRLPPVTTAGTNPFLMMMGGPASVTLFGGDSTGNGARPGYRFRTGLWIDRDHTLGLEGSFFFLAQRSNQFQFGSSGVPQLVVPFTDATTGMPGGRLVAGPGESGSVASSLKTRLWGAEANLRHNLWGGPNGHVDVLAGFRALGLDDNFQLGTTSNFLSLPPTTTTTLDRFATRNRFYGGQLGVSGEYRWCRWSVDGTLKVALGGTNERSEIAGSNFVNGIQGAGGIFAQGSNSRDTSRDRFGVIPELNLNVGYQVTDHLRATVGYDFLYWSSVIRAGEQIPRSVNPAAFAYKGTDFWAHGANLGLEFRY